MHSTKDTSSKGQTQYLEVMKRKQSVQVQHNSGGKMEGESPTRGGRFFSVAEEGTPKNMSSRRHSSMTEEENDIYNRRNKIAG